MNNNTLIAGFEDIMTHIKNQEIRIKKLEEENKKLKDTTAWEDYEQILKDAAQKKIDSLEEENKKLHNIIDSTNADYEKLVDKNNNDNLNFADILSERDDEIKKLKDDLMRDELDVDDVKDANLSLKEENEKLKKECRDLRQWHLSDDMINDISAENIDEFERDVRDNWDELNGVGSFSGPPTSQVLAKKLKEQMEANNTHDTTCMCDVCEENDKLTKELVTVHEYLWSKDGAVWQTRMTKDIIMNLMIKIIKELCDEDSVDIEKEWQADTRGVKWTDKDYNDFMINICKEMDDDNWNDFGGISLQWKDDTLYFRRVEP